MRTETKSNDGTTKAAELKAFEHEACVLEMSAENQKAYEEIRNLLDGQRHDRAKTWYAVGRKVVKIMADSEYGKKAVAKIAKALGRDASLLYEAGRVTETWLPRQFAELVAKRDRVRGNRLSWSHFVELARVDDSRQRGLLVKKVLNKGLSVRELKREIAGPKPQDDREEGQVTNVARALRNFMAACETTVENTSHWDALIFDVLDTQDEELTAPRMPGLLRDARATLLQAKQTCEDHMARLDACIARAEELLAEQGRAAVAEEVVMPIAESSLGRPHDLGGQEADDNG